MARGPAPPRAVLILAAASAFACACELALPAPIGAQERHAVVLVRDGTVYAEWSETEGAAAGVRAVLFAPSGAALDTLAVVWTRGAIAALAPADDRTVDDRLAAGRADSLLATSPGSWIERLTGPGSRPSGTLRVPLSAQPGTLDPAHVVSLAEKQVVSQIFEGLVRLGPDLEPLPAAARVFERAGRRWTFQLRPDARFHHGRPVQAADVVATLERALAPATRAPRAQGLLEIVEGAQAFRAGRSPSVSGVRALDSLTVEIVVVRETAPLLSELAAPVAFLVPTEMARREGSSFARSPVGSGPFRFVSLDAEGVVLAAAEGRSAGVDTVLFRRVEDAAAAVLAFELGRLDLVSPPESEERRILASGRSRPEVLTVDEVSTYYLGMNTRAPGLKDRARRRMIAGSIDRALAVRVLLPGRARLANGLLPPVFGVPALNDSAWLAPSFEAQARMRASARQMPALSLWVPAGSTTGVRIAEFVSAALLRLGLRVSVIVRPWAEYQRAVLDGKADLFYLSWFGDGADPVAFVASMVESRRRGAGGNRTFYASAAVDSALAAARRARDRGAAVAVLRRAERIALSDAPLLPLFHSVNVTLVRPGISGLALDPLGAPRYDGVEVRPGR